MPHSCLHGRRIEKYTNADDQLELTDVDILKVCVSSRQGLSQPLFLQLGFWDITPLQVDAYPPFNICTPTSLCCQCFQNAGPNAIQVNSRCDTPIFLHISLA